MPPDAHHLLIHSEALDAVDARSSASPKTDAYASTTWRLQPPSASLVLWRKPRNPSSVAACALDPGVDATAAARPELLHGNSPSTLDVRVPATKDQAHDHTARLTIHSSQPGVSTAHSSNNETKLPSVDANSMPAQRGMVLPFVPLSLTIDSIR